MTRYHTIPDHMRAGAQRYVERGIRPGDFLSAVLSNDLMGAFQKADVINFNAMEYWARWLHDEAPAGCYGSPEKFKAWIKARGLNGLREAEIDLERKSFADETAKDEDREIRDQIAVEDELG